MKKFIHHIRRQSEETRRHILHVTTIVFAAILFSLWVYSLGVNLTNKDTQVKINNEIGIFSALKGNIIGGYKSISDQDSGI